MKLTPQKPILNHKGIERGKKMGACRGVDKARNRRHRTQDVSASKKAHTPETKKRCFVVVFLLEIEGAREQYDK
jgi:hypothetical protein